MKKKEPSLPPELPTSRSGTPLRSIPDFPEERAWQLASLWVSTAEEFVSMASTPQGLTGLGSLLEASQEEMETLVGIASSYLPRDEATKYAMPAETEFSMGAVLKEEAAEYEAREEEIDEEDPTDDSGLSEGGDEEQEETPR
jgi:hypothetical protein